MFWGKIRNKKNILTFLSVVLSFSLLTVPTQALDKISDCEYIIDNMRIWSGDLQSDIFSDEDLINIDSVEVDVTRRIQGGDDDLLLFAYYSDTNKFIGMSKALINIKFGIETSVKVPIDIVEGETLSEIRVFVWNDLTDIAQLSNVLSSKNNMFINPSIEKPKYGVIDDFQYDEEFDSYMITVLNEDGLTKRYIYNENTKIYNSSGKRIENTSEGFDMLKNYVYSDYENDVKTNVKDRVIRYDFRKNEAKMLKVYFLPPSVSTSDGTIDMKEYDAYSNTIGSVAIKDDFTKILNLDEYLQNGSFYPISCVWFIHGMKYEAYGYDDKIDGVYPFVVITDTDN